jgi:hypothetical protein
MVTMSNGAGLDGIEGQQLLRRLSRKLPQDSGEISTVISPGARATAWAVKVKSLSSYNVYNVRAVEIGDAGSLPVEIGIEMQAVNLAESFLETGQLSPGTYAVMFRVGEKNVFYVPV